MLINDLYTNKTPAVAEGVPQPGPSSGAPKQFGADAKIQTRQMTVKDIISSVPGVPYYNNVVDDWDAKDYSWGVTKKVIEYATYLKDHPESLAKLPPAIVLNGKFEDGAHRVSAIWLLQQRMDPKNPLWKNTKLNVQFVKQGVAENTLNEFAPSDGGGDSGNYFQALASAWYNGTFDSGSLEKGIKSQQDVERLLQRGVVCPDGVTRKFGIDYNSNFDGVVISSDDYYEHADHDETDSRTGKPFGPYDYMEFGDDDLDESARWRDPQYKGQLYTQEKPDYNDTREYDRARWDPKPKGYQGRKEPIAGGEFPRTDPLVRGAGIGRTGIKHNINLSGKRKGLPSRDQITSLKQSIKDISGRHTRANLPEQGVAEDLSQNQDQVRQTLNAWMNQDQQYEDPSQRAGFQAKVWPYIQQNIKTILADKGEKGNGDYPAAPYAAWLLVQHMDAYPQNQIEFYNALKQAIPNHPKIQFLRDRAAVNQWIMKNANNPEYFIKGKALPNPTVNVRNPAMFKDAGIVATSREEALANAEQAGNKLLVAAVNATKAQTQPSYKQGVAETSLGDYGKKAQLSRAMAQTNRFFDRDDAAKVAGADQTIAKREKGLARADARRQPYTPPAQDAEKMQRDLTAKYPNIDELVAKAEQRRDPNYDYAEGDAYYRGREAEQNYQKLKQIQRVIQGLNESQAPFKKNYLYEGLDRSSLQTVKLWESAGQRIMEAQLTVDQINQLFKSAEQDATAAGGNRTMVGKGKDATMAVNKAWEDLKTKVQNSSPIKSVDAAYDSAAEKLKQATGGDQGVMKYVEKYRAFAKANPVAQSLIYSALIAAAGISGAGLGGAAALGLFKLVDKLLQGEKFSSAAYAGAKTGALAYGASKVADYFKGPKAPEGAGGDQIPGGGQITDPNAPDYNAGYAEYQRDIADVRGYDNYITKNPTSSLSPEQYADKIGDPELMSNTKMMNDLASKMGLPPGAHQATFQGGVPVTIDGKAVPLDLLTGDQQRNIEAARAMRQAMSGSQSLAQKAAAAAAAPDKTYESLNVHASYKLTDADLYFIFSAATQLNEGVWDSIKGTAGKYAGKAADWAKTQGTNLTTKVTADKLKSAWLKADSPTDSDQVYNVMTQAGVAPQILDTVYKTMNIPTFREKALSRPTTPAFSSAPVPAGPASKPAAASASAPATTTPASPEATPNAATQAPATSDAPKTKQLGTGTGRINPATGRPWTPSELKAKYAQPQPTVPTPDSGPPAPSPELEPPAPKNSSDPFKAKRDAAALAAQQAMGDVASPAPTPTPTVASTPAPASSAAAPSGPPGFNAGNLAQLPGMSQSMQPKPAAPKPAANYGPGPAGYKTSTTSVGPTAVPAGKKPTTQQQQEYYKSLGLAEDLSWSKNFDPGRSLYRRMKKQS